MMEKQIELMEIAKKHEKNIPAEVFDAVVAAGAAFVSLLAEIVSTALTNTVSIAAEKK